MKKICIVLATLLSALCLVACNGIVHSPSNESSGDDYYTVTLIYDTTVGAPSDIGPTEIIIKQGETLTLPTYSDANLMENGGYCLECWETEGGKTFESGVYTRNEDITLKAKWVYYTPTV